MPPQVLSSLRFSPIAVSAGILCAAVGLVAADARIVGLITNTAWLALGTCLVAVPVGTLLSVAILKTDAPGRRWAAALLLAMIFVPLYLQAAAWDAGFGLQGWYTLATNPQLKSTPPLADWRGAIWVHGIAAIPWVVLIVLAGLRAVDPELEEDAVLSGSAARVLMRVTLPSAAAAVVVAIVWVVIVCAGEIAVTDLFQVRTFAEEVYTQAALGTLDLMGDAYPGDRPPDLGAAGLWCGVLMSAALAFAVLAAVGGLISRAHDSPSRPPWSMRLGRRRWIVGLCLWLTMATIAGVPLWNLVYKAGVRVTATESGRLRSWSGVKAAGEVVRAPWDHRWEFVESIKLASAVATTSVLLAIPLVWTVRPRSATNGRTRPARATPGARGLGALARRVWTPVFLGIMALCLTIPGPVLGVVVIELLNRPLDSPLWWVTWLYDQTLLAPWLVQVTRVLPIVAIILWPVLASVPQTTLDSAASEGAGWWRRLVLVALPQRWPAVAAAWLISFAVAAGELAATILVMPPRRYTTLAIKVFGLLHYGVDDKVAAICLALVLSVVLLTLLAGWFLWAGRWRER